MSATLTERIAQKWIRTLRTGGGRPLSMRELARAEGISLQSAREVLVRVRQTGLISWSPGRRPQMAREGGVPAYSAEAKTATDTRASHIRLSDKLISLAKKLNTGTPFPKVETILARERVGSSTLTRAFRSLERRGLAHKYGKSWVVGPEPDSKASQPAVGILSGERPAILVLARKVNDWKQVATSERTRGFSDAFFKECRTFGIATQLGTAKTKAGESVFPAGKEEVRKCILEFGSRYLGALLPTQQPAMPNWARWVQWLARFEKPVVRLDVLDLDGSALTRSDVSGGKFYRCHYEEAAALKLAAEILIHQGHRSLAYVNTGGRKDEWIHTRAKRLETIITRHGARLRICLGHAHPVGAAPRVHPRHAKFGKHLTRDDEVMLDALSDPTITAFIAPNDHCAELIFQWLREHGRSIPGDYSLISFDNSDRTRIFPISTIGFGFDNLGYSAFHLLTGYMPVTVRRDGFLGTQPYLIDRGSLGPPRNRI